MLTRALLLRMAGSPALERIARRNRMAGVLARRFVAGEAMEDVIEPVRALNAQGITATLDYLGENVTTAEEASASVDHIACLLAFIQKHRLDANVSLKPTQVGLSIGDAVAEAHLRTILEEAARSGQFVRMDMEGSDLTQRTLDLFWRLWKDHRNTGVVIQSYLRRSDADLEPLIDQGVRVRLVKGAYMEPADVAYQLKSEVDAAYDRQMRRLMDRAVYPAIATHDPGLIGAAREHAAQKGIAADRYEFQMLYGIRRDLQTELASRGYRMRVYMPFGTQWYGYLMRRLAERPANLWFVARHVFRR